MDTKIESSGNWSHLRGADWSHLLQQQPQFADKCDWSKLDGTEWARLLVARPELTDRCDWDKLDARNWSMVLARRPELAGKFESAAHDWAADEKAAEAAANIPDEEAALCESEGIPAEEFFKES